jgi:hypothetical protein
MKTYKIAVMDTGTVNIDPSYIREVGRPIFGDDVKITLKGGGVLWLEADYRDVMRDVAEANK